LLIEMRNPCSAEWWFHRDQRFDPPPRTEETPRTRGSRRAGNVVDHEYEIKRDYAVIATVSK
jgi:hypothetical protein